MYIPPLVLFFKIKLDDFDWVTSIKGQIYRDRIMAAALPTCVCSCIEDSLLTLQFLLVSTFTLHSLLGDLGTRGLPLPVYTTVYIAQPHLVKKESWLKAANRTHTKCSLYLLLFCLLKCKCPLPQPLATRGVWLCSSPQVPPSEELTQVVVTVN